MEASCFDVTIFHCLSPEEDRQSHTLLYQAAGAFTGLSPQHLGPLETNPWGKPSFSLRPDLHFSITHSADWWLCGFSSRPLGLDLQVHHSHAAPAALSRRFFHPLEDAFLSREGYRSFFDLWSAKESWVKYTGHGFFDDPATFSVVSAAGVFPSVDGAQLRLLPFTEGYSLCLCAQTPGEIRFSPLSPEAGNLGEFGRSHPI